MQSTNKIPVPLALKVLGWLLLIGGLLIFAKILFLGGDFSSGRSVWNLISKGATALAGLGILRMKRWAIYLYFSCYFINATLIFLWPPSPEIFELYTQPASLTIMVAIPLIIAVIVGIYWRKLT